MDDTESWVTIAFKAGLLLGLLYLTSQLLTTPRPWTFLDAVNLVFHEAGHVIFTWGVNSCLSWAARSCKSSFP